MPRCIRIPADPDQSIVEITMDSVAYPAFNEVLGVDIVERVTTQVLYDLSAVLRPQGGRHPTAIMLVDETGRLTHARQNMRATVLYHPTGIYGDVLIVGEDMVWDDGYPEPDFVSLPDAITVELVGTRIDELLTALDAALVAPEKEDHDA